jgi:hypothetical protein
LLGDKEVLGEVARDVSVLDGDGPGHRLAASLGKRITVTVPSPK